MGSCWGRKSIKTAHKYILLFIKWANKFPKTAGHSSFLTNDTQTGVKSAFVGDYLQPWINTHLVAQRNKLYQILAAQPILPSRIHSLSFHGTSWQEKYRISPALSFNLVSQLSMLKYSTIWQQVPENIWFSLVSLKQNPFKFTLLYLYLSGSLLMDRDSRTPRTNTWG